MSNGYASTATEILARRGQAENRLRRLGRTTPNIVFPYPSLNWGKISKIILYSSQIIAVDEHAYESMVDDNYWFGAALHHHKHPDANRYHKLGQSQKLRYRLQFANRAKSKHPHMKKYAEVWHSFTAMRVAAQLGD